MFSSDLNLVKIHRFEVPWSVAFIVTSKTWFEKEIFGFTICDRILIPLAEPSILLTDHFPLVFQSMLSSCVPPTKLAYCHFISLVG